MKMIQEYLAGHKGVVVITLSCALLLYLGLPILLPVIAQSDAGISARTVTDSKMSIIVEYLNQ